MAPTRTRRRRGPLLVALVVLAALVAGACSRSPGDLLAMELDEWDITIEPDTAQSGPIRFDISHVGELEHHLVLTPGTRPEDVPRNEDGSVDITSRRPIDQITSVTPGTYRVNAPNIPRGDYLWVCALVTEGPDGQMVSHLDQGMWAPLVITRRQGIVDDQS
jgi:hypothetical protein